MIETDDQDEAFGIEFDSRYLFADYAISAVVVVFNYPNYLKVLGLTKFKTKVGLSKVRWSVLHW